MSFVIATLSQIDWQHKLDQYNEQYNRISIEGMTTSTKPNDSTNVYITMVVRLEEPRHDV